MEKTATLGASLFIKSIKDHIEWLSEGGRDLELQDAAVPAVLDGDWRSLAKKARAELAGFKGRLGVHGPFIGFSLVAGFDPLIAEAVVKRLLQALDFASELGATQMVLHSPFIGFGASPFATSALSGGLIDEIELARAIVNPALERAESFGCQLVIENVQDNNPDRLIDLVDALGSPSVRMSLDIGHAFITHQFGGPPPDVWIRRAGQRLGHVHVQDTDGQTDRHWAPGQGSVNWHAVFEALAGLSQAPRLILELKDHGAIEGGASYLAGRGYAR